MNNLALGLAQLISWLLAYTTIESWLVSVVSFDLRNVLHIGFVVVLWAALLVPLWRVRSSINVGPMYVLLALSNIVLLATLIVHANNDYPPMGGDHAAVGVNEIMSPSPLLLVESFLYAISPFAKFALIVSIAAIFSPVAKAFRDRNQNAT